MLYLIKKELTANVRYMLTGLMIFIIYAVIFYKSASGLFTLCLVLLFYTVSATNLVVDERYKIDLLLTSLPIRRKDIVLSKYILLALIFIASFILYTIIVYIANLLGYERYIMPGILSLMVGLFTVSFFNSVMLPLSYKFGAQSTRYIWIFLFLVIFFLSSVLGGTASVYLAFFEKLKKPVISVILLAGSIIINYLSFLISYKLYNTKDF